MKNPGSAEADVLLGGLERLLGEPPDLGIVGVDARVELVDPLQWTVAPRGPAGDHPQPAATADRHVPLQHDARGDPLAHELEQQPRLVEGEGVLGPLLAPAPDLADVQHGGLVVPLGSLDVLPRDADGLGELEAAAAEGAEDVQRVAGAADVALVGGRVGEQALPPLHPDRRALAAPPHCAFTVRSRSVRRCCSSAASSPNMRLYSTACSTGLVRWSLDFRSLIRRAAVSSSRRKTCSATYDESGSLAVSTGSTTSALIAEDTAGSVAASRSLEPQPGSPAPAPGPPAAATSSHTAR